MKRHGTADTCKILLSTLTLAAFASASPASGTGEEGGGQPGVAVAEAISVTPAVFAPAVLMPNAQVPAAPPALDAAARAAAASKAGVSAEESGAERSPLRLTAAQPWQEGSAYLVISGADTVHPEASISLPAGPPGQAALRLKVEEGASYLVDFAVHGAGAGLYVLGMDSVRRELPDDGSVQHVVTAVTADAGGWVTLRLSRQGSGFHLYAVEVSRLR